MHTLPNPETIPPQVLPDTLSPEAAPELGETIRTFRQGLPEADKHLGNVICTSLIPYAKWGVQHIERDPVRTEDLTQESMLRVYRALIRPQEAVTTSFLQNPQGYAYRVGENTARSYWLRLANTTTTPRTDLIDVLQETVAAPDDVEQTVIEAERLTQLIHALGLVSLPERALSILQLNAGGSSYREITDQLGIRSGSIGNTLRRAKQTLVQQLMENGYDVPRQFRHGVKDIAA